MKTAEHNKQVYMLGDIVHNEEVVKQVKKRGIKKIGRLGKGSGKILLIRAHGCANKTIKQAKKSGYTIVDATCPMVKEIHGLAKKAEKKGSRLIVIGDKKHDEVSGIVGQLSSLAIVIDDIKHIPGGLEKIKHASVVVQSTQNLEKALEIINALRKIIPLIEFHNTICQPTRIKQQEIKRLPKAVDIMIIIGSKTSANTKRLFEISKSLNARSYWIDSDAQIKKEWFKNVKNVGVSAGASTPQSIIKKVVKKLRAICP
jgi:4-hydroxy-3-methylbut-2-enyl diphosphate reductase